MSTTGIKWTPIDGDILDTSSMDVPKLRNTLKEVFGDFPLTLDESHIKTLMAMSAVMNTVDNPYADLAILIQDHGSIILSLY